MAERPVPGSVDAVRPAKAAELVAAQLAAVIAGEDMAEGDRLPNERDLIAQFGVARGTLREALRLLETQGAIRMQTGRGGGPVVARPGPRVLAGSMSLILQIIGVRFRELVDARELIEPLVYAEAARRVSAADVAQLRDSVARQWTLIDDESALLRANDEFHDAIAVAAGNAVLHLVAAGVEGLTSAIDAQVRYDRRARESIVRAHERIVETLAAGDPDAAAAAGRRHLAEFRRYVETHRADLLDLPVRWWPNPPG